MSDGRWVPLVPDAAMLHRARVGCGWQIAVRGRMHFWAGRLEDGRTCCLYVEHAGPGLWRGAAYELQPA